LQHYHRTNFDICFIHFQYTEALQSTHRLTDKNLAKHLSQMAQKAQNAINNCQCKIHSSNLKLPRMALTAAHLNEAHKNNS